VVDSGITLIDTARGYGLSEERIGRYLGHRRSEIVLSTKVGYDIPGYEDWSGPIITAGVEAALHRLRTDYIDIVHLHSCPLDVLQQGDVIDALEQTVAAGKVRVAAYSGDNEPLWYAIESDRFRSIQTSINIADQRVIDTGLPMARERGLGVIAKRPLANAPWRFQVRPEGDYSEVYWERLREMQLDPGDLEWDELALRFVAFLPGVSSCIVGTRSPDHLRRNVAIVEQGPLPEETVHHIRAAFQAHDQEWVGKT
jgi:aryl-alcohol dehydrogenase-like predicted oxidoreductase